MFMRFGQRTTMVGVLAAGVLAAGQVYAEVLRFSDYGPNRGTRAASLEWFADQVRERSGGELDIEFHWGGSLLGMRATLEGLSSGVADMGTIIGFAHPRELRTYNIGDLPVENSDIWIGLRAMHDMARNHPAMQREFEDAGVRYVTNFSTGPIQLLCRQEISSLEDIDGLRIRASGPYGDALNDLGASIERMSQADVYQALDSGLIDCNQNYYYSILAYRQYEVAPYVLELDWGQNMSFGVFMSELAHERLDESQRAIIDEVADEFIDHFSEALQASSDTDKQRMLDGIDGDSITVVRLNEEDFQGLLDASHLHVMNWVERANEDGIDGQAVLDAYQEYIDTYTQEYEAQGYPWTR